MAVSKSPRQPPALRHGISSRWLLETLEDDIEELAGALVGSSPREAAVLSAARKAAEAILQLRHVKAMKTFALNDAAPGNPQNFSRRQAAAAGFGNAMNRAASAEIARDGSQRDQPRPRRRKPGDPDDLALLEFLESSEEVLRKLDNYERRASSRRATAVRELDLARIDAERRGSTQAVS